MINVRAIGPLNKYLDSLEDKGFESNLCKKVSDVKALAGIPVTVQTIIVVNGKVAKKDQAIQDGDDVLFMSPISGG